MKNVGQKVLWKRLGFRKSSVPSTSMWYAQPRAHRPTPSGTVKHLQKIYKKIHLLHLILNTEGKPDFDGLPPIDWFNKNWARFSNPDFLKDNFSVFSCLNFLLCSKISNFPLKVNFFQTNVYSDFESRGLNNNDSLDSNDLNKLTALSHLLVHRHWEHVSWTLCKRVHEKLKSLT